MKIKYIFLSILFYSLLSSSAIGQSGSQINSLNIATGQCCSDEGEETTCEKQCCKNKRNAAIAPIGVMNDHYHHKQGLMLSYRYMLMNMEGNQSGTEKMANSDIFPQYMMAPQDMTMQMHMVGVMYGLTDRITLMGMMNIYDMDMNMSMMNGNLHQHQANGIGDISLSAVAGIWKAKRQAVIINAGLSIPTGAIDKQEINHMLNGGDHHMTNMPYAMRLGSGTVDALIGATYTGNTDAWNWGVQVNTVLRTGENELSYTLGNNYGTKLWLGYNIMKNLGLSLRVAGNSLQEINGKDESLMSMMSPPNNVANIGGEWIETYFGTSVRFPKFWNGLQLGAEFGLPVYQNTQGIQMSRNHTFTLGLKFDVL